MSNKLQPQKGRPTDNILPEASSPNPITSRPTQLEATTTEPQDSTFFPNTTLTLELLHAYFSDDIAIPLPVMLKRLQEFNEELAQNLKQSLEESREGETKHQTSDQTGKPTAPQTKDQSDIFSPGELEFLRTATKKTTTREELIEAWSPLLTEYILYMLQDVNENLKTQLGKLGSITPDQIEDALDSYPLIPPTYIKDLYSKLVTFIIANGRLKKLDENEQETKDTPLCDIPQDTPATTQPTHQGSVPPLNHPTPQAVKNPQALAIIPPESNHQRVTHPSGANIQLIKYFLTKIKQGLTKEMYAEILEQLKQDRYEVLQERAPNKNVSPDLISLIATIKGTPVKEEAQTRFYALIEKLRTIGRAQFPPVTDDSQISPINPKARKSKRGKRGTRSPRASRRKRQRTVPIEIYPLQHITEWYKIADILILFYDYQKDLEEIAAQLNLTTPRVRQLRDKGIKALRRLVQKQERIN